MEPMTSIFSVIVDYLWLDATGKSRSKSRTLWMPIPKLASQIPIWNFDGSSTGQASTNCSEVVLVPVKIVPDPFRRDFPNSTCVIALCECLDNDMNPLTTNTRSTALEIFTQTSEHKPMYGLEQEYVLLCDNGTRILGWPRDVRQQPHAQGKYFCGVGFSEANVLRYVMEEHYKACLYAGLCISGTNIEVLLGQAEFQIGPVIGIDAADQMYIARYLLERIAEKHNMTVSYDPKPVLTVRPFDPRRRDWNGSGLHVNYSSIQMRTHGTEKYGLAYIHEAIEKLASTHKEHLKLYGDNSKRLTGMHETSSIEEFTWGVGDRTASVRIGFQTVKDECGYLEDRRPASDADVYVITSLVAKTIHM